MPVTSYRADDGTMVYDWVGPEPQPGLSTPCKGEPTTLYRVYTNPGNGETLVYIGIAERWEHRFVQHAKRTHWWDTDIVDAIRLEHLCCRRHAIDAEKDAIRAESPMANIEHNMGRQVDL